MILFSIPQSNINIIIILIWAQIQKHYFTIYQSQVTVLDSQPLGLYVGLILSLIGLQFHEGQSTRIVECQWFYPYSWLSVYLESGICNITEILDSLLKYFLKMYSPLDKLEYQLPHIWLKFQMKPKKLFNP